MTDSSSRRKRRLAAVALAVTIVALVASAIWLRSSPQRMLVAPMMGLDACITPTGKPVGDAQMQKEMDQACGGPEGSAAAMVESTLAGLQKTADSHHYELGYTLHVPLLKLFHEQAGDWLIDKAQLGRIVRTLRDTDRPVIVYLFSTHFSQNAPIERALAADPANLSWTKKGPLPVDKYYGEPLYNWSFASMRTALTARRVQAAEAVIREICKLEPRHIAKIKGLTLLGELHHLYPDFEAGMGFAPPYLISDYSDKSRADFKWFLERYFGNIKSLNRHMGTHWTSFEQITPPSKDIRTDTLLDFTEHIDPYAHGYLPISGWAYLKGATDAQPPHIRIYRNGDLLSRVPVNMSRQDVLAAMPQFGSANTGWRFDMDFRTLQTGFHNLDIYLEAGPEDLVHLGTRKVAILDKRQEKPQPVPQKQLPASRPADATTQFYLDLPGDQTSYFYNPMATYWHAFRALQVSAYLQKFSRAVEPKCLQDVPRFTHQIIPFTNPGWDETKFAIDASLRPLEGIGMGISLYGEPTYGTSFSKWLKTTHHKRYGITEFHPLKAMDPVELGNTLRMHESQGAEFLSFFVEPRWKGQLVSRGHNLFSFDPANPKYGADKLYDSARTVLSAPR